MRQRGMRADFQPHVHAEVRQRAHGRGETHRFANATAPVRGVARFAGATFAGHGAEKWNVARLRFKFGELASKASDAGRISG